MTLVRIADNTFIFKKPLDKPKDKKSYRTYSIKVPRLKNTELQFNLAKKAADLILAQEDDKKPSRFRLGQKKWKFSNEKNASKLYLFLAKFFDFFRTPSNVGIVRYKISSTCLPVKHKTRNKSLAHQLQNKELKKSFKSKNERINYRRFLKESQNIHSQKSVQDYLKGVRGSIPLSTKRLSFDTPSFHDPFTELSALAFQKYEKEFISKDYFDPLRCDFCLIKKDGKLILVNKNSSLVTPRAARAAIKHYREHLMAHYGKEKIAYIEHLYELDINGSQRLTPEHIYRMNLGVTNLEFQDVDDFLVKLNELRRVLDSMPAERLQETSLKQFLFESPRLTGTEMKGLYRFLQDDSLQALSDWLQQVPETEKSEELSPDTFRQLHEILAFNPAELRKAYTGRKIFGVIRSFYSNAEMKQYKPWIDQHQHTQSLKELARSSSMESYYEKLSHITSKIHYAKEHPTEGFRVGALIPAPPLNAGGPLRWYKIAHCASNSYGIFTFTLEPASKDSSLPAIKLFRSTASASYAMHGGASPWKNNFSPYNSPGHQGRLKRGFERYDYEFIDRHTIPLWMGYAQAAGESQNMEQAVKDLSAANRALLDEFKSTHKKESLSQIIKAHDAVLYDISTKKISGFVHFILFMLGKRGLFHKFISPIFQVYLGSQKGRAGRLKDEKADAKKLVGHLKKIYRREKSEATRAGIANLIQDLRINILTNTKERANQAAFEDFKNEIYDELRGLETYTKRCLDAGKQDEAAGALEKWTQLYESYALSKNEHPSQKTASDLVFCGHSLGGASSQVGMVELAEKGRMPLKNQKLTGCFFDDPAINKDSNDRFKAWGNNHWELFRDFGINIRIFRRQEAGDVVPSAGQEHLGAAFSMEELEELNRWLEFDAAVAKKRSSTSHYPISLTVVHETRFLEGERKRTFFSREDLLQLRKEWKLKTGDPNRKAALKQIDQALVRQKGDYKTVNYTNLAQGIFDRQGRFRKSNKETYEKDFRLLNKKLWHLPKMFHPMKAEKIRTSLSMISSLIRNLMHKLKANYPLESKYVDGLGNFAVSATRGVLSQRSFALHS